METNKKNISEEIIEGNKLIAEFMGYNLVIPSMRRYPNNWKTSYWERNYDIEKHTTDHVLCEENGLKYHSSWDWLMPVVEKIEKLSTISFECKYYDPDYKREDYEVKSFYFIYSFSSQNKKFIANSNNKLEAYWLAVVEFIKYYNSCQK